MDISEFQRALTLGLGRAVLHLRNHDAQPCRDIILDACLHNKAHDPQVEGSRAQYMFDVIRASGEGAFFANAVIQSLSEAKDDWDTPQRFELARLLAQSGDPDARPAMVAAFQAQEIPDSDVAVEFIQLDGIQGLIFVVGQIGSRLLKSPDQWEDDFLLDMAHEIYGHKEVETALREAAQTDSNVRAYLDAVEANRVLRAAKPRHDPKDGLTWSQLQSLIASNKAGGLIREWAQIASDSDLESAAWDLVHESDAKKLKSYLLLFWRRRFPLPLDHLFELLEREGPVPRHTLRVLANLEDDSIRNLAFKLMETSSPQRDYAIDLLVKNFRDGDHQTIESWCYAESDPNFLVSINRSLRDFFNAHPEPEREKRIFRNLYEREPCAHCRCDIVERLLQLNALTDDLRLECEFDSYSETRALVKAGRSE